jgi:transketolase
MDVSLRETYGKTITELGAGNRDIVVLDADLSKSTMTHYFAKSFPDRFFNVGIAEQNLIGIAAGLAASGKIPFVSTFAVFAPGRCFDQIRMSVAQPKQNVKIVTTHGGITVGEDGITHQAIEDLALSCSLPGMTVIVPADALETSLAVRAAAATNGPFLIRLPRIKLPLIFDEKYTFQIGVAAEMRSGSDVTVIATGIMVSTALNAAESLQKEGISCRVVNMSTLKPIDENAIIKAAMDTGAIVTAEEHLEHGGLGSIVARITGKHAPVPLEFVALHTYAQSGKPDDLLKRYGLTAEDIEKAAKRVMERKSGK